VTSPTVRLRADGARRPLIERARALFLHLAPDLAGGFDHRVGIQADRVDAEPDQRTRPCPGSPKALVHHSPEWIPFAAAALDGQANHFLDTVVALVVVERHDLAVPIDAEGVSCVKSLEPMEKPSKAFGELIDEESRCWGSRTIAYTLSPFSPRRRPRSGHRLQDEVRLGDSAHEREQSE